MLIERVIGQLKERRQNLLDGHINCIPSPFPRFKYDFLGIERATQMIITSFTKGAKTQFVLYLLFEALLYLFKNPDKASLKIFYFVLEETPEGITNRFMSYLLYKIDKIRISPKDLRSTDNNKPISEDILDKFNTSPYKELLEFFEKTFIFSTTDTAMGIYSECQQYAEKHGKIHYTYFKYRDEFGEEQEGRNFDHYEPDDPHEYRLVVIDHCGLLRPKNGQKPKDAIDELSTSCAKYLRNRYFFTPILIQQQNADKESNDSIKLGRTRPDKKGLADSSYTANDCNILLGLFSPARFGLAEYLGYDIKIFKDRIRFVEVVINRDGEMGGIMPLYFDGATCTFAELPRPDDPEIQRWYSFIKQQDERKLKQKVFFVINKVKNLINGITKS